MSGIEKRLRPEHGERVGMTHDELIVGRMEQIEKMALARVARLEAIVRYLIAPNRTLLPIRTGDDGKTRYEAMPRFLADMPSQEDQAAAEIA